MEWLCGYRGGIPKGGAWQGGEPQGVYWRRSRPHNHKEDVAYRVRNSLFIQRDYREEGIAGGVKKHSGAQRSCQGKSRARLIYKGIAGLPIRLYTARAFNSEGY